MNQIMMVMMEHIQCGTDDRLILLSPYRPFWFSVQTSGVHLPSVVSAHGPITVLFLQISSPTHTSTLTSGGSCLTCPPWRETPPTWSRRSWGSSAFRTLRPEWLNNASNSIRYATHSWDQFVPVRRTWKTITQPAAAVVVTWPVCSVGSVLAWRFVCACVWATQ